jgi:hypothetical protein
MGFHRSWFGGLVAVVGVLLLPVTTYAAAGLTQSPSQIVTAMIAHENEEMQHRGRYVYLSQERSERTGGHLWAERVAETKVGKIRMLVAEDGQPLSGERAAAEKARIMGIEADPEAFSRHEQAAKDDEKHALTMMNFLPRAFVFENERLDGEFVRIDFKPNPEYAPQSMEERVLHGMSGSLVVDPRTDRLHRLEGRLPEDVSIGFGFLATIKAGSNFSTTRDPVPGNEWKTSVVDTDITGRAIFFKSVGKKEHAEHKDFVRLADDLTVAQTAELLLK